MRKLERPWAACLRLYPNHTGAVQMSLEDAIKQNTAAIEKLTAVMQGAKVTAGKAATTAEPGTNDKTEAAAPAKAKDTPDVDHAAQRAELGQLILKTIKVKGRDVATAALKSLGAAKQSEIPDAKLGKAIKAFKELVA